MIKILLLSNDERLRKFCLELQSTQLSIVCISSFCDTLDEKDIPFSLILLDFNLIENGCARIIENIRAQSNDSPVLFLVPETCMGIAAKMLKYGIEDMIALPCCSEYLREYINRYAQPIVKPSMDSENNCVFSEFIGVSAETCMLKRQIILAAKTNLPVLILGETGTGKSFVARLIHQLSNRHKKNFVEENTAAMQDTLIEGELFGTKLGAYTGAITRIGLFEHAHEGILFLDEITCMNCGVQAKLLHVLETGEFRAVGDVLKHSVDVRLISATNCPLARLKDERFFRRDLYYRLSGIQLYITPLRNRKNDIAPLAQYFLNKLIIRNGQKKILTTEAILKLEQYHWSGNIRELFTCIERAYYTSLALVITESDITFVL